MLGKKLYKTRTLDVIKFLVSVLMIFLINDFVLQTYTYDKIRILQNPDLWDVIKYHYRYPWELIIFFFLFLGPAFYYSFIRGTRFYEKGFIYNKGLPFLNTKVKYDNVNYYQLLHPKCLMLLKTQKGFFLIADNSLERVIAILDQHDISGNLASEEYKKLILGLRRVIFIAITFTFVAFVTKKILSFIL